jgi:8-oxo-dGTP pyrophosphatase MutT (NUDIX family)
MEVPNCYYRVSIKALILDETRKKFLLVQEPDGRWELPGGGLDHGENIHEALKREIKEEMGLAVTSIGETPTYFFPAKNKSGSPIINALYETTLESLDFTPTKECVAIRFFSAEEAMQVELLPNVPVFVELFR